VTQLKIISAGAVKPMVEALGAEFARASGVTLDLNFGTVGSMRARIEGGEAADLVFLSQSAIAGLVTGGFIAPGSVMDVAATVTGVFVRAGAPIPDISTEEAFTQALLNARTVAYTDPKAGGSSGTIFAAMLEQLGIADAINAKAVLGRGGHDVATAVAEGRAEIGSTFISEVLPVAGAQVIGPHPGRLHNSNTYTASIHARSAQGEAARAFQAALTDPLTRPRWTAAGLEPAF
jgi:molybdate transport system substrate-binding protein